MEGVKDGRRFFEVAREVGRSKPIILWKGGMSEQGARAAASHTGALAGSASIWKAMFKQTGIIDVTSVAEVVDCAVAFHDLPLPKGPQGRGHRRPGRHRRGHRGQLLRARAGAAARCRRSTVARLREVLPPVGTSVGNPTDTGVASLLDPSLYEKAIEIVADDDGIDMILVISTPVPECLEHVAAAAKAIDKPLAVSVYALPESEPEIYRTPQRAGRGGVSGSQARGLRARAHGRVLAGSSRPTSSRQDRAPGPTTSIDSRTRER